MKWFALIILVLVLAACNQKKCKCPIPVLTSGYLLLELKQDTSTIACEIYKNIDAYLKDNLKDYSSYQPMHFADFSLTMPDSAKKIGEYLANHGYYDDSVKAKSPKLDSLSKIYSKYKPVGYSIKYEYRAKNGFGAYGVDAEEFMMDTSFKIINVKEL